MELVRTAMDRAVEKKDLEEVVNLLANNRISVDLRLDQGQEMLLSATENDSHAVADSMMTRTRGLSKKETTTTERQELSILLAAYDGNAETFRQMIAHEALDLSQDFRKVGETSLFLAVEQQNLAMAQTLLHLSVDQNARDSLGQTALHRATRRQNVPLVKLLLENKALVDCKDDCGRTPWSANVRLRDNSILDVLRHAGADPNTKGVQGVSELYTAAKNGETDLVKFMLDSGTDPSIQTGYQWAPLHWAAAYGHTDCVRLLVDAGADVSVISDQNMTSLEMAIQAGHHAAIKLLFYADPKNCSEILVASYYKRLPDPKNKPDSAAAQATKALEQSKEEDAVLQKTGGIAAGRTKLRLVFDKPLSRTSKNKDAVGQYVYVAGTSGPSENIYQISHLLETQTACIIIRKAPDRAEMWDYPLQPAAFDDKDVLFDISRSSPDYQQFRLDERHPADPPTTLSMYRDSGGEWMIRFDHTLINMSFLRVMADWSTATAKGCRWTFSWGELVARSGWEDATPHLCFEVGVNRALQDVVVACWIAKLWSETVVL